VIAVMPDKMSKEKIDLLRAYGAEVVVAPTAVPPDSPESYYRVAERLTREIPGAFQPNQYANPANPAAHYATTGPELWEQTDGRITHFVAGASARRPRPAGTRSPWRARPAGSPRPTRSRARGTGSRCDPRPPA
jgi:cysteine synthase